VHALRFSRPSPPCALFDRARRVWQNQTNRIYQFTHSSKNQKTAQITFISTFDRLAFFVCTVFILESLVLSIDGLLASVKGVHIFAALLLLHVLAERNYSPFLGSRQSQ
jgi:hypothetical protein